MSNDWPLPIEVPARPFGSPRPRPADPDPPEAQPEPTELLEALDAAISDPLYEIAVLLRKLTVEQAVVLANGLGDPKLEHVLVNWARLYMGEQAELKVAQTTTMKRRA